MKDRLMTEVSLSERECVLIVDDEEMARDTLSELVEMAGCTPVVAANGREALNILKGRRPCLVILDLVMPVMTGQELLRAMRATPELANITVVISTSAPQHAPPGVPIIPKPVNIANIVSWIQRTCSCSAGAPLSSWSLART